MNKLKAIASITFGIAAIACGSTATTAPTQEPSGVFGTNSTNNPPLTHPTPTSTGLAAIPDESKVTYSKVLLVCHIQADSQLPDPACTPGSVDPKVTQATIDTTICVSGWTKTVRPPVSETSKAKTYMYTAYGIPPDTPSELDHLVPLELGGSNDVTNLWPEVGSIPNAKDEVENTLHSWVCSGKMTLIQAQTEIAGDWQSAEAGNA